MNKIPVCFIYDKKYIMPTAVAVTSMLINRFEDTFYDIYFIGVNCEHDDEKVLEKFFDYKNVDLHFVKTDTKKFSQIHQISHVSQAALIKFDLCKLIPEYEKILYIDGDVIIQKDLSDFYNIELDNNYMAGPTNTIDIVRNKGHMLSGAYLQNSELMRQDNISQKLLDYRLSLGSRKAMDGTAFNEVLQPRIKAIPIKFDLPVRKLMYERKYYKISDINKFYGTNYNNYREMIEDAVVLHYDGGTKPWLYSGLKCGNVWDYYYKKSPYADIKLQRKNRFILLKEKITKEGIKAPYYMLKDYLTEMFGAVHSVEYKESDWN